jgi:hypothetical protein
MANVNKDWIRARVNEVRDAIGREVVFSTPTKTACTICLPSGWYDAGSDSTYYVTCPVCSGNYWTIGHADTTIIGRIHWVSDEAITATPGGKYYIGEATVTIEDKYLPTAQSCQTEHGNVSVDGHDMIIQKIIPVGAPEPNRYRVILRNSGDKP